MNLIEVTNEHFDDLLRMRNRLYTDTDDVFHKEEMALITSSDIFTCFIAENDAGQAIGFIELSLRNIVDGVIGGPVGYIEGIYLDPEYRNKGVGQALISGAMDWFRNKGCQQVATDTEIDNHSAQAYFEKLGFQRKWTIVQYLKDIS